MIGRPRKEKRNKGMVILREFGFSYGDISKIIHGDKRNVSSVCRRDKGRYNDFILTICQLILKK